MLLVGGVAYLFDSQIDAPGPLERGQGRGHPQERRRARDRHAARARGHHHRPPPVHRRLSVGEVRGLAGGRQAGPAQGRRLRDQAERQHPPGDRHALRGQDRRLQGDDPGGAHQPPDRRAAEGRRQPRPARSRPCRRRARCCRRPSSSSAARRARPSSTACRPRRARLAEKAWAQRKKDLPLKSLEEAIVLASIVEKETGRGDERERVAAVFVNRLKPNMRLQSDPTILYGLSGGKTVWSRPIQKSEIAPEDRAQHLPDRRPAADADLQPGPRRDRGRAQSGRHQGALLRRRRHRRPRVRRDAQGAQRQRPEMARGREGHARAKAAAAAGRRRHADHGSASRRGSRRTRPKTRAVVRTAPPPAGKAKEAAPAEPAQRAAAGRPSPSPERPQPLCGLRHIPCPLIRSATRVARATLGLPSRKPRP